MDPCAEARALAAANARLVVHTIGFGVDDGTRQQLRCIASVARGTYFDATSLATLSARLAEAAARSPAPPPAATRPVARAGVLAIDGDPEPGISIENAETGAFVEAFGPERNPRREVPPGLYRIKFANGDWSGLEVKAGETTAVRPAYVRMAVIAQNNIELIDLETGEEVAALAMGIFNDRPQGHALVPGRYRVTASGFVIGDYEFAAGVATEIAAGVVRIVAGRSAGYRLQREGGEAVDLAKDTDFVLPPGRYRLTDDAAPDMLTRQIEVAAGRRSDVRMPE